MAGSITFKWGKPKTLKFSISRDQGVSLEGSTLTFSLGSSMLGAALVTVPNASLTPSTNTADLLEGTFTLGADWHSQLGGEGQHALKWQLDVVYPNGTVDHAEGSALLLPSF